MTFPVEAGKTSAHVFRSKHPHSPTGDAVAKVHCILYHKDSNGPINNPGCSASYVSVRSWAAGSVEDPSNPECYSLVMSPCDLWTLRSQHSRLDNSALTCSASTVVRCCRPYTGCSAVVPAGPGGNLCY